MATRLQCSIKKTASRGILLLALLLVLASPALGQVKTRGANKEKPERPDVAFWFPPADLTNASFLQNAIALEKMGGRTQYLNPSAADTRL